MLDVSAGAWVQRIQRDEAFRKKRLDAVREMRKRYHGPAYKSDSDSENYFPENFYYKYVGLMVPRLIYDNPRVWVNTRRPGAQGEVAEAMRHGLNRWCRDTNVRKVLEELAYDTLFGWGVSLRSLETVGQKDEQVRRWPKLYRLAPERFGLDSFATHPSEARYAWHMTVRDKDDLVALAKKNPQQWHLDVIEGLTEDADTEKLEREASDQGGEVRNEIVYYEVWYPEHQVEGFTREDGFHGSLFTLTLTQLRDGEQKAQFLRPVRPFYGPKTGPYTMYGVYRVPNELYPLSPLVAMDQQIEDLNRQVRAAADSNARHKTVGVTQATDPQSREAIVSAKDGDVIALKQFDRTKYAELQVGGATAEQRQHIAELRMLLAENGGLSDPQTGSPSGEGTATEHAIADQASTTRTGFIRKQFQDGVSRDLAGIGWYMYHDDAIEFPLGAEAAKELAGDPGVDLLFQGGDQGDESGFSFDDLELEIEAFSMERTDEGLLARRMAEMDQLVLSVAPIMPQVPWVDWKQYFYARGQMSNWPDLGKIVDPDLAAQFMGMQLAPGPAENQPRLTKDRPPQVTGQRPELIGRMTGAAAGADRKAG